MGWITNWYYTAKEIILSPSEFFEKTENKDTLAYPLKFGGTGMAIGYLFYMVLIGLVLWNPSVVLAAIIIGPVAGFISGAFGVLVYSLFLHMLIYLLGGNEHQKTAEVVGYSYSLAALSWIPIFNIILAAYGLYIQAKGIEKFHEISLLKATAVVLAPFLVGFTAVLTILAVLFIGM